MARSKKSKKSPTVLSVKGKGLLSAVSTTSASGLFVSTRYEIDSTLIAAWSGISSSFEKWRVLKLTFEYVPIQPTSKTGVALMSVLEDVDDTTPSTVTTLMSQRVCTITQLYEKASITYVPKYVPWLYCRDSAALDDRWEMPADFIFATNDTTENLFPGYVVLHYHVEFDLVVSSSLNLSKMAMRAKDPVKQGKKQSPEDVADSSTAEAPLKELGVAIRQTSEILSRLAPK
jgi:hypothetical protein